MKSILTFLIVVCFLTACSTFDNRAKEQELTNRVQQLEQSNSDLQNRNSELVAQNQRLKELAEKIMQRLDVIQGNYQKLVQENMDLYQKLYTERMDEQKKVLSDRSKNLELLDKEMKTLFKDDLKGDLDKLQNETKIDWGHPKADEKSGTKTEETPNKNTSNLDDWSKILGEESNGAREEALGKNMPAVRDKDVVLQSLKEKREKLQSKKNWEISDERKYWGIVQKLKASSTPEEEKKILEEAMNLEMEFSKRIE